MKVITRLTSVRFPPGTFASRKEVEAAAQQLCRSQGWHNAWVEPEPDGSATISRLTEEMSAAIQQAAQLRARRIPLN